MKDDMKIRMDDMERRVSVRMDDMERRVSVRMDDMKDDMKRHVSEGLNEVLRMLHDHNREKIAVLSNATYHLSFCSGVLSGHLLYFKGKYFGVTAAHSPCFYNDKVPAGVIPCAGIDVALLSTCYAGKNVVNVTSSTVAPRLGDEAVAVGYYKSEIRAWVGALVGFGGVHRKGIHFTSNYYEVPDELIFQGAQLPGMSGAAVVNGLGYVGVAHILKFESDVPSAQVIPWSRIEECVVNNWSSLPSNCDDVNVLSLPSYRV
jgi:hypothetical protein